MLFLYLHLRANQNIHGSPLDNQLASNNHFISQRTLKPPHHHTGKMYPALMQHQSKKS
jgi:hypothetical protein